MIEGDIQKCFDEINHHKLMELIETKIKDRKFTRLLWKSLKAGYMEFKQVKHNTIGTFQGSIISPILANIYLHQLDKAIEEIAQRFNTPTRTSGINPEYNKLRYEERKLRETGRTEEANALRTQRLKTPYSNFQDDEYKRMTYVRYADD